jgi:hypothetical protein
MLRTVFNLLIVNCLQNNLLVTHYLLIIYALFFFCKSIVKTLKKIDLTERGLTFAAFNLLIS